jgi:ATP-dependent Clp protease protease subunit
VSEKIKEFTDLFHSNGVYLPTRSITITGSIDEDQYETVLKNLHALDSKEGTINIFINSEGGDVEQGLAIYDAIKGCKNFVRGMVYGTASSAASFILQACDERLMAPHAYLMVHIGEESSPSDHPKNKERWDKHQKELGKQMEDIYLVKIKHKKKRFTRKQLQDLLEYDTILYAKDAIELGLADRVEEHF